MSNNSAHGTHGGIRERMRSLSRFISAHRHPFALAALCAALWAPHLGCPVDLRWDGGVYYILGTSLAEGKGYRLSNEPGEIRAIQYPPLLPCLVAAHQWVLGTANPYRVGRAIAVTNAVVFGLFVLASYALTFRVTGSSLAAFGVGIVCALSHRAFFFSTLCFAEIHFAAATVLFLLVADRGGRLSFAAAAVSAATAYLLRTAGVALMLAWCADALFARRWGVFAARAAACLAPVLAWQVYVHVVERSPDYRQPAYAYQRADYQNYNVGYAANMRLVDPFCPEKGHVTPAILALRLVCQAPGVALALGESLTGALDPAARSALRRRMPGPLGRAVSLAPPDRAIHAILAVPVLIGLILLFARGHRVLSLYVAATCAMVCLAPWPQQATRYLMPVLPLAAIAMSACLLSPVGRPGLPAWATRSLLPVAFVLIVALDLAVMARAYSSYRNPVTWRDVDGRTHVRRLFYFDGNWRNLDKALEWLGENSPADTIIASQAPQWTYLRTGRRAIYPPFEPDARRANDLLASVPVDYLVVDNLGFLDVGRRYAKPVADAFPDAWQEVYGIPEGSLSVYRRRSAPAQ